MSKDMNNGHADRFKFRVWNDMQKCYSMDDHYISEDGFMNTVGDYVLEQCTGLKDKNGKLIYEGDIVQMSYPYSPQNKYIFKWGDCCWELWLENEFIYVIHEKMSQSMEIIGNIHQNADLLE